jgi:hypothetical protein
VQVEVREAVVVAPLSIDAAIHSVFDERPAAEDPLGNVEVHHRGDLPPASLGDGALDDEARAADELAEAPRHVVPVAGEPPCRVCHLRPQVSQLGREVEDTTWRENTGDLAERLRLAASE